MLDEVNKLVGITPFVIIPSNDFSHLRANHHGGKAINNGAQRAAFIVAGNKGQFAVTEDAFHGRFGSNAHSFVDFFLRCFFLEGNHKIGQRNIRSRDADTHAVQFTGKFRKDKTRSLGCTSRGRNDGAGTGTSASQVFMGSIKDLLVIRVGMNRRHEARFNPEVVQKDFSERSQAVCRAGSIGNDIVFLWIVHIIIDTKHDGQVFAYSRSRDKDLFGPVIQMRLDLFTVLELPRRFKDNINTQFTPRNFLRFGEAGKLDAAIANNHDIAVNADILIKRPMKGIVFEQMSIGVDAGTGVYCNNFDFRILHSNAECTATDTTKTIDTNFYHFTTSQRYH